MKSVFEIEVNVRQEKLAEMFADPENYKKWMGELEGYEIISGKPGMVGSKYRIIQKNGDKKTDFIANVTSRNLPNEFSMTIEEPNVAQVSVTGQFIALSPEKTKFISKEEFKFKGISNKIGGLLYQRSIKGDHHSYTMNFKHFAENID
jgi:hypothetical protein